MSKGGLPRQRVLQLLEIHLYVLTILKYMASLGI